MRAAFSPACLSLDFTKWNPSPGSHPQYTLNCYLPHRGRRSLKHGFSSVLFLRVRTLALRLPCKSGAAVLASGNKWGVVFCLLPGPESHTGNGSALTCSALTHAHSKMRPPSGMATLAEAGILYRVVPLSSVVGFRPAGTPGARVLAS